MRAVTVAVRGTSRSNASSPKPSPRNRRRSSRPSARHVELALRHDVEAVARLALAHHRGPGRHAPLLEPVSQALQLRRAERSEQRQRAQQRDLDHRHGRAAVDLGQRARGQEQRQRQQRTDPRDRPARAGERDERGRQQRANREAGHRETLQHTEDAGEHVRRGGPLQDRAAGDVEQRARRPGDGEQNERACHGRPGREQHERRTPDEHAEHERRQQPAPPHERGSDGDPGNAAGAEGGVQVAGSRAAEVEHRDREHDVEHVQRADRHELPAEQADEHPRRRLAREHAEAGERLLQRRQRVVRRRRAVQPRHEQRRHRGDEGHHGEDPARRGDGEQARRPGRGRRAR